METVEVLMSTLELKNEKEYIEKIEKAQIKTNVTIVNQKKELKKKEIKKTIQKPKSKRYIKKDKIERKIYTYQEKGASKSRNKLIELAKGDICIFADDDIIYEKNYEEIIKKAYKENPEAEGIFFYVENISTEREENKRIKHKRTQFLDVMKLRIYELSLKKETIEKIKEKNIKFNTNFGPGTKITKGEDTIFLADLIKNKIKLYNVNEEIGITESQKSSWFNGINEKYLFDQGAIFKKIAPKTYWILIIQYVIRKYKLYKENFTIWEATKIMIKGSKEIKSGL